MAARGSRVVSGPTFGEMFSNYLACIKDPKSIPGRIAQTLLDKIQSIQASSLEIPSGEDGKIGSVLESESEAVEDVVDVQVKPSYAWNVPSHMKYDCRPDLCENIKQKMDNAKTVEEFKELQSSLEVCYDDESSRIFERVLNPLLPKLTQDDQEFRDDVFHYVAIPEDLINKFLKAAKDNTEQELECVGLLYGYSISSVGILVVTHLYIPLQHGTKVNCEIADASEQHNFAISESLTLLGWIHTHPTHDNFLSSTDIKAQYLNQSLLRDSIAIVCSNLVPPRGKNRIYSLTKYGMEETAKILADPKHMVERPHRMYQLAQNVFFNPEVKVTVRDEREDVCTCPRTHAARK